ncbi:MAG TPA: OmpA family protein [Bryobacteraceae bacterium]|nr:OmpA family protein [Bryobacteraceae bacterium]
MPVSAKATPPPPPPAQSTPAARSAAPATRPAAQTPRSTAPARSTAMTQQERETLNQRLAHLSDALFDYDKATIRADASTTLRGDVDVVKGILQNYPNQKLIVEGDTDERGSAEYNLALGDKRAHSAEEFLVSMGIPQNQLTVVSYGKERPVCQEHDESCWQKNRRAHITAAP